MLEICKILSDKLNEEGVRYCHWKSNTHLSESLEGKTDLDVLVDPAEEETVRKLLSELHFKLLQTAPRSNYPSIEDFVGYDAETGEIVHLHLHYRLVLGRPNLKEFRLPWEERLLENRRKDEDTGFYIIHPRHELLLLLVRYSLKLRWRNYFLEFVGVPLVRGTVREEFDDLRERVSKSELKKSTEELIGPTVLDEVLDIYENGPTVRRLRRLRNSYPDVFAHYRRYGRLWGEILAKKREFRSIAMAINRRTVDLIYPYKKLVKKGGTSVAFIGADGSGKSTVSDAVSTEIRWKIDTEQIYFGHGSGSGSFLLWPARLERRVSSLLHRYGRNETEDREDARKLEMDGGFTESTNLNAIKSTRSYKVWDLIKSSFIALDKLAKLRRMNIARNNGCVVIADRYPNTDPELSDSPRLQHWADSSNVIKRKLAQLERYPYEIAHQHPPEIVIRLDVTPETAIQRKDENSLQRAERRIDEANRIEIIDANIVDVDANQELDEVISESMSKIWDRL